MTYHTFWQRLGALQLAHHGSTVAAGSLATGVSTGDGPWPTAPRERNYHGGDYFSFANPVSISPASQQGLVQLRKLAINDRYGSVRG